MRSLPALLLIAAGCRAAIGDDTVTTLYLATTDDTGEPWDGFVPSSFGLTDAVFAVDARGSAGAWTDGVGGATMPVELTFVIADVTVGTEGFGTGNSCTVTFQHPGPVAVAGWSAGLSAFTAFELPADATATSDCSRLDFPPGWEEGAEGVLRRWTWGFGVGPLDPQVDADLLASLGQEDYDAVKAWLAGGGAYWDGLVEIEDLPIDRWLDGWVDTGVVFAYEVDDALVRTEVDGAPVPLDASTLPSGSGVRPAVYDLQTTTLLTPANLLLREGAP